MSDNTKKVKSTPSHLPAQSKSRRKFKVIAEGGVYVRPVDRLEVIGAKVLPYGTVVEALKVLDTWVKTEDGYIVNQPFSLEEVKD